MKYNFIIFLSLLLFTAPVCSGAAVMESVLTTIVPSAAVVKTIPSAKNNTVINPENGSHTGLEAIFDLKTNGDDNTYDFVFSSTVETAAGIKNAYFLKDGNLYLMLANKDRMPEAADLADITSGTPQSNKNVIAYPVINNSEFKNEYQDYNGELCCKILSGGKQDIQVSQYIGNVPLNSTYSIADDSAGVYEASITLNIYRKP